MAKESKQGVIILLHIGLVYVGADSITLKLIQ